MGGASSSFYRKCGHVCVCVCACVCVPAVPGLGRQHWECGVLAIGRQGSPQGNAALTPESIQACMAGPGFESPWS